MTYFLWTMVALWLWGALLNARRIATGEPDKPSSPGVRVAALLVMLVQISLGAWAFLLLLLG